MKTIIAGSRTGVTITHIEQAMQSIDWEVTEVVSGCAAGADTLGIYWANMNKKPVKKFPADWRKHGNSAGPIRNRQMAEYADALVAVWDGESRGTRNMIDEAMKRHLKVFVLAKGKIWKEGSDKLEEYWGPVEPQATCYFWNGAQAMKEGWGLGLNGSIIALRGSYPDQLLGVTDGMDNPTANKIALEFVQRRAAAGSGYHVEALRQAELYKTKK